MVIGPPRELEGPRPNTQSGSHYRGGRVKYRVKAAYVTITNVFGTRPRMRSINFERKRGMESYTSLTGTLTIRNRHIHRVMDESDI